MGSILRNISSVLWLACGIKPDCMADAKFADGADVYARAAMFVGAARRALIGVNSIDRVAVPESPTNGLNA